MDGRYVTRTVSQTGIVHNFDVKTSKIKLSQTSYLHTIVLPYKNFMEMQHKRSTRYPRVVVLGFSPDSRWQISDITEDRWPSQGKSFPMWTILYLLDPIVSRYGLSPKPLSEFTHEGSTRIYRLDSPDSLGLSSLIKPS